MPFFKSIIWLLLTAFFGLLQLWITIGSHAISPKFPFDLGKLLIEGVILFFATALVTALALDFWFSDKDYNKAITGFLFVLYPAIILGAAIWLFTLCSSGTDPNISMPTVIAGNYTVLTMTGIYAVIVKTLMFA